MYEMFNCRDFYRLNPIIEAVQSGSPYQIVSDDGIMATAFSVEQISGKCLRAILDGKAKVRIMNSHNPAISGPSTA